MKKIILAVSAFALVLMGASNVSAQDKTVKKQKPEGHKIEGKQGMAKRGGGFEKLNLTDAQKTSLKAINDTYRKDMKALMQKEDITVKVQRESKKALNDKRKKDIENLLTAEQKAEFAKLRSEHKGGRAMAFHKGKNFGRKGGMRNMAFMKDSLGLTDVQLASLKTEREKTKLKLKAIKENTALTEDQKRAQFKAAVTEQKEALDKILTAEQKEKLKTKQAFRQREAK
ncbi:Spy/CpxP family protein refolding chaperone [Polluticaenibacter yanchengensis]|uniref:Spy/CpxP family protein refolding chaperone n=1 Tax=Polluticaenibacter yanchengensis TaxID=3014562 RepID=A0ABT4UNX9_9BACT|nr:Spy/CpxP family protein refolding chaperone [Chitinophagaceae bacterium LY-5]